MECVTSIAIKRDGYWQIPRRWFIRGAMFVVFLTIACASIYFMWHFEFHGDESNNNINNNKNNSGIITTTIRPVTTAIASANTTFTKVNTTITPVLEIDNSYKEIENSLYP